jgi:hypothetical protein
VSGSFDGGKLSTIGGAPLVYMVEQASGYVALVANCIKDWRCAHLIKYTIYQQVWQRVLLICAGFADTNDSNFLRHEPMIKLAMGLDVQDMKHLASQPTICRLENKLDSKDCYRMAMCMLAFYIMRRGSAPKEIVLDFDGSCFRTYGDQAGSSYRGYYETNMLFPLFVYDQDGWLICAILRPGCEGEARLTVPVLKRLVKGLRQAWPKVRIILRADAAFGNQAVYDWCEDQGKEDPAKTVYYIICHRDLPQGTGHTVHFKQYQDQAKRQFGKQFGQQRYIDESAKKKYAVEKEVRLLPKGERKKELKRLSKRIVRVFGNFYYQAGKGGKDPHGWRQERRIVGVCRQDDWGQVSRYFVTNLPEGHTPQFLIEQLYSARGGAELRIKDFKGLEGDKMSCSEFAANQGRLLFHALAYNTLYQLREHLPRPLQTWTLPTIQKYLIRMAVRITETAKNIVMHWASDFRWQREIWVCEERLRKRLLC